MITQEHYVKIHVLHQQGVSIRAIARKLNLSRTTVRRHFRNEQPPHYSARPVRPSKLNPYKDYIRERIDAAKPYWIPAAVLFREIKAQGYQGSASMVRAFVATLKPKAKLDPVVRFETAPGQQLQVDFTTIKRGRQTLKAFVATLGYSRSSFVHFTTSEKQDDWLTGIELALTYFGGVPREILFDNAKCIMIERDAYGDGQHRWHPALLAQAKQFGYVPKACRPYRAKTKGKVERFNRYLKESYVTPLMASLKQAGLSLTPELANAHIGPWLTEVADQRIHGTTGVKPAVRFVEERFVLQALPVFQPASIIPPPVGEAMPFESIQHSLQQYDQVRGILHESTI